jgi:hypothetical protein
MRSLEGTPQSDGPIDFNVDSAVLFPVGKAGILGEIPWNRTSFVDAMSPHPAHQELPTDQLIPKVDLHDAVLATWLTHDVEGLVDYFEDDCALAIRSYQEPSGSMLVGRGKKEMAGQLEAEFRTWRPNGFTVLNRIVTDWYVFAEVLWTGELRDVSGSWTAHELRTATTLPLSSDGRLRAILGYGTPAVDG